MDRPGIYTLGDRPIAAAVTELVLTSSLSDEQASREFLGDLEGALGLSLFVEFTYGAGGSTAILTVQTSLNQGEDWIDIARFDFAQATARKVANLSGLLSKAITAVSALGSEGVNDGVLGDRFRAILTTTGTYTGNTSIAVRASAR